MYMRFVRLRVKPEKMALDPSQQASVVTSEDLSVEGYHVVTGESF